MDTPAYKIAVSRCIMASREGPQIFLIRVKISDFLVFYVISVS